MNCGEVGHKLWQCPKREKWKPAGVGSVPAEARGAYHQQHADSVAAQQMASGSGAAAGAGAAGGASPSGPADESNAEWQVSTTAANQTFLVSVAHTDGVCVAGVQGAAALHGPRHRTLAEGARGIAKVR